MQDNINKLHTPRDRRSSGALAAAFATQIMNDSCAIEGDEQTEKLRHRDFQPVNVTIGLVTGAGRFLRQKLIYSAIGYVRNPVPGVNTFKFKASPVANFKIRSPHCAGGKSNLIVMNNNSAQSNSSK